MSATLLDYVSAICRRVTADKAMRGIEPAAVTYTDVIAEARDDILDCMRALAVSDDFEGHITINHVPMLIPRHPPKPPDDTPVPIRTLHPDINIPTQ